MLRNKEGFTLIELVMIIVILGILAAVAIPRYTALQTDARVAALNGLAGAVRSSAGVVHARAILSGSDSQASTTVNMGGGTTVNVVYGRPAAADGGINTALADFSGFTFATGSPTSTFVRDGSPANCAVGYTQSTGVNAPPTVTVVTGGC